MKSKGFPFKLGIAAEPQAVSDISTKPLREAGCARVRALPRHCSSFGAGHAWPWAAGTWWVWSSIPGFHPRMPGAPPSFVTTKMSLDFASIPSGQSAQLRIATIEEGVSF